MTFKDVLAAPEGERTMRKMVVDLISDWPQAPKPAARVVAAIIRNRQERVSKGQPDLHPNLFADMERHLLHVAKWVLIKR